MRGHSLSTHSSISASRSSMSISSGTKHCQTASQWPVKHSGQCESKHFLQFSKESTKLCLPTRITDTSLLSLTTNVNKRRRTRSYGLPLCLMPCIQHVIIIITLLWKDIGNVMKYKQIMSVLYTYERHNNHQEQEAPPNNTRKPHQQLVARISDN